jgi:hypothetical protein
MLKCRTWALYRFTEILAGFSVDDPLEFGMDKLQQVNREIDKPQTFGIVMRYDWFILRRVCVLVCVPASAWMARREADQQKVGREFPINLLSHNYPQRINLLSHPLSSFTADSISVRASWDAAHAICAQPHTSVKSHNQLSTSLFLGGRCLSSTSVVNEDHSIVPSPNTQPVCLSAV